MGSILYLILMSIGFRSNQVAEKYNKGLLVPSSQRAPCWCTWIWYGALTLLYRFNNKRPVQIHNNIFWETLKNIFLSHLISRVCLPVPYSQKFALLMYLTLTLFYRFIDRRPVQICNSTFWQMLKYSLSSHFKSRICLLVSYSHRSALLMCLYLIGRPYEKKFLWCLRNTLSVDFYFSIFHYVM